MVMGDAFFVGGLQTSRSLSSIVNGFIDGHGLAPVGLYKFMQRLALDIFHGDEHLAIEFLDSINMCDIGMIECRCRLRFSGKMFLLLFTQQSICGEEFQRHLSFELGVLGFVQHPHAAFAKFFEDFVMENGFADHWLPSKFSSKKSVDLVLEGCFNK